MALAVNPKLPVAPPSKLPLPFLRRAVLLHKPRRVGRDNFVSLWSRVVFCPKAVEESKESEAEETNEEAEERSVEETSEIGAEIKKTLAERKKMEKEGEGGGLLSGVAEEIGEIEWPAFGKVLGTTGVVLGVIAGSSVVLLTVNAVLAELSDRVFAGRGVQDFFS